MCTLTLPLGWKFYNYRVLRQIKTKSYENTKFSKQINTHHLPKKFSLLIDIYKKIQCAYLKNQNLLSRVCFQGSSSSSKMASSTGVVLVLVPPNRVLGWVQIIGT
jgi:hypothetical protein